MGAAAPVRPRGFSAADARTIAEEVIRVGMEGLARLNARGRNRMPDTRDDNADGQPRQPRRLVDTEPLLQFFVHAHLPPRLREVSRPFGDLAVELVTALPGNEQRTRALEHLLEAKDCAVRAMLYVHPQAAPTPEPEAGQ